MSYAPSDQHCYIQIESYCNFKPCRQRSIADVDALRAQYAESTEQLRAQLSAEAESARTARFEEVERIRSEKNAEIAVCLFLDTCAMGRCNYQQCLHKACV